MKVIGIVFIVLSAGVMGFRMASALRGRCMVIRQLQSALQILKHEIAFQASPLPKAFARAAAAEQGVVSALFAKAAGAMENRCWMTPAAAFRQALQGIPEMDGEDRLRSILLELAAKLGKYDLDSQRQAIELAQTQLEEERRQAEQERTVKGRTYETLGICTGLAVSILLL